MCLQLGVSQRSQTRVHMGSSAGFCVHVWCIHDVACTGLHVTHMTHISGNHPFLGLHDARMMCVAEFDLVQVYMSHVRHRKISIDTRCHACARLSVPLFFSHQANWLPRMLGASGGLGHD